MIAVDPYSISWDRWAARQIDGINGADLPTDVTEDRWHEFAERWMDRNLHAVQGHVPPPHMFTDWREWAVTLFLIDRAERFAAP